MNSRAKGKRGELELVRFLKGLGYEVRRGQQYSGINGDGDVVGVPGMHIECKQVERLNVYEAYDQSARDARDGEIPHVFWKRNYHRRLVILDAEEYMSEIWPAYMREKEGL